MSLVRIQKKQEAPATGKYLETTYSASGSFGDFIVHKTGPMYIGIYLNAAWPSDPIYEFTVDSRKKLIDLEECPASEVPLATVWQNDYNFTSKMRWFKASLSTVSWIALEKHYYLAVVIAQ